MTVYGWDLSNHDWERHPVSLADAKKAGISLVTHKATEGDWYKDPYFKEFRNQLQKVDFPVEGSYHVLNHGINVAKQTDYWIDYVNATIPNWAKRECWIWQIDAEALDGYAAPTKTEIVACGNYLVKKLKILPSQVIVYGPKWAYEDRLTGIPFELWASSYVGGSGGFKNLYPGDAAFQWDRYSGKVPRILQYSSSAVIGAQHTCDANAIRVKDAAALQHLFKPTPKPAAEFDLLEWIMALPGAPKGLTYKQFIDDIADGVLKKDAIPVPEMHQKGNPNWQVKSILQYLFADVVAIKKKLDA